MKKLITVLLSVCMLVFGAVAFAACGDGNAPENGGNGGDGDTDKPVTLQTLPSENDVIAALQKAANEGGEAYGVLGEPSLTNGQVKVDAIEVSINFQTEWKAITGFDGYPQASLIARGSFARENSATVDAIAAALAGNGEWLEDQDNVAAFEQALKNYNTANADGYQTSLVGNTYTQDTIARCNLGYQSAQDIKASVKDYVERLSGSEPADGFFYASSAASAAAEDTIHIYLPDGTPGLAVANLFTEGLDGYDIVFHIVKADQIGTIFNTQQDADLAIMPTIGAANVFAKGVDIQLVSTNVFGNLYIASVNGTVNTLDDLKGKTVSTPSAATTLQLLQYLLEQNDIEYGN